MPTENGYHQRRLATDGQIGESVDVPAPAPTIGLPDLTWDRRLSSTSARLVGGVMTSIVAFLNSKMRVTRGVQRSTIDVSSNATIEPESVSESRKVWRRHR